MDFFCNKDFKDLCTWKERILGGWGWDEFYFCILNLLLFFNSLSFLFKLSFTMSENSQIAVFIDVN